MQQLQHCTGNNKKYIFMNEFVFTIHKKYQNIVAILLTYNRSDCIGDKTK